MGVSPAMLELICKFRRNSNITGGSILQLGRQEIHNFQSCQKIMKSYDYNLENSKQNDDNHLFTALGFDVVSSMDASNFEAATIIHDLNLPISNGNHPPLTTALRSRIN